LRAISEIAVAINVWSVLENPNRAANARPFCRAVTTSPLWLIATRVSVATLPPPQAPIEHCHAFFEVQCGFHPF
jgi:hypothetical protein